MTGETPAGGFGTENVIDHYDFDDPLFLHPSDNGIVSIISIKLTSPNLFFNMEKLYDQGFKR